jgi:5-formyltetrahydrofolate cyclo-ligase
VNNKADIRAQFLRVRQGITESYRQQSASMAADYLISHPVFSRSKNIACYCAHKNEFETIPLIQAIWHAGKKCYLPVLCEGKSLSFVCYENGDKLEINQHGILEPFNFSRKIPLEKLDMIIMPLVAYDSQGRRLGMGGGYYDRALAYMHTQNTHPQPHLVGLAYVAQCTDELPSDPWDIKLHSIITEQGIRTF